MLQGRIHSIETMGLVDGPGVRTVFFLQGCPLRCSYCHNPDSQKTCGGTPMTPQEVVALARRYRPYHQSTGGGVTFSGGEPLMQGEFLAQCLALLKAEGFHTAIDTSGFGPEKWMDSILSNTDCVLMDLKATDPETHLQLTGKPLTGRLPFWLRLQAFQGMVWIRHVVVPGFSDTPQVMEALFHQACQIKMVEKIELLPYHKHGSAKYALLGLDDPLAETPAMDQQQTRQWEKQLMDRLTAFKAKQPAITPMVPKAS
ncbi:pyruvate formate-lyase-activating protein [Anoxynatronum buryatiense]|uniref:Pyruvate formate-lyase-activating enzyme n=1 Tax=Anoxynatronum buryatiense TaxID=489973 RepID=A0AA46AJZ4_9CLOT|nr:pyruvate formate-lyase-activating protein [Anoxynatronum buryatiense]SMP66303.1 pyruvate formate lyase activating enzyme [Anoxynatronum buryatiense]